MWIAIIALLTIAAIIFLANRPPTNFPPGPWALPLLGCALSMLRLARECGAQFVVLQRLAARYGPIVGLRAASGPPAVLLSGHGPVSAALARPELAGRPRGLLHHARTMGRRRGVIATDGVHWQLQRKFLMQTLRDFGFGKVSMEYLIQDEANKLVGNLKNQASESPNGFILKDTFILPVINCLWYITAGVRYDQHDTTVKKFIEIQEELIKYSHSISALVDNFPWFRFVSSRFKRVITHYKEMWTFFNAIVDQHLKTLSEAHSRDLTDVYLHQHYKKPDEIFSKEELIAILKDLFAAGSETTSNTLSFFFLYIMLYPSVQTKIQEELDDVVGHDRLPSLSDRPRMHYLSSVILEVQRISNIAPATLPHRALADVQMEGYTIPKNSTVIINLYSVHMDMEHWGDPEAFRPERFLDNEHHFVPDPWVIPFGSGLRRCLGESLAKCTIFLITSTVLQSLRIEPPKGKPLPSTHPAERMTLDTQPYEAVIVDRSSCK